MSPTLLAKVTAAVLDEGRAWQSRPLAAVSPLLAWDALLGTSRHEGPAQTNAVSVALGITVAGAKERLGLWRSEREGAQCWRAVFPARHPRGVAAGLMACVAGLQGLPEARAAVFPQTPGPLCLGHTVRHRRTDGPGKARQVVAADLRALYAAATLAAAAQALARCAARWDAQ